MSAAFRSDAPIPPAPPPPPPPLPRYGQRAATAIARLAQPFFYGSRPTSAQGHRPEDSRSSAFKSSAQRSSSPVSSRTTIYRVGSPIAAFDYSPSHNYAVLAGRDVLKTIKVIGASCTEDFNIRSTIITHASVQGASKEAISAQHRDNLAANDVKWSNKHFDTTIATAAANGRIILYDINHAGVELVKLKEHTRQVHRLAFNPHHGAYLLSGSQDATTRLWDLRTRAADKNTLTFTSKEQFQGNNEGVRDVKWSPSDGFEFAIGTDNGTVQKWDIRNAQTYVIKLNAHERTCQTIDWHPAGRFLASAGPDKAVKIFDMNNPDRRMKPSWQLKAPQAVLNVRWRPNGGNASTNGAAENLQCTQLATSYDQQDPRIHVWDLRRPHIPFQELDRYDKPATDMLWHSEDILWSVGGTGLFTQTDLKFARKPLEKKNVNVLTAAPDGQIACFAYPWARRRMSSIDGSVEFLRRNNTGGSNGERLSEHLSATDDSYEEPTIFNSTTLKKRRQKSASSRSFGNTPPTANGKPPSNPLDEAMKVAQKSQISQIAASGHVLGIFDSEVFGYLARYYKNPMYVPRIGASSRQHEELEEVFEANAVIAEHASQYRLAQTWRILGQAIKIELQARAKESLTGRLTQTPVENSTAALLDRSAATPELLLKGSIKPKNVTDLLQASKMTESSSQMPTPVARPTQGLLTVPEDAENLLAQSIGPLQPQDSVGKVSISLSRRRQSFERSSQVTSNLSERILLATQQSGADFIDTNESRFGMNNIANFTNIDREIHDRRAAMDSYRAKPRTLLRLDDDITRSPSLIPPPLYRHDSDESFQLFSGSTDSSHPGSSVGGSFDDSRSASFSDVVPERWPHSHAADTRMDQVTFASSPLNQMQAVADVDPSQIELPPDEAWEFAKRPPSIPPLQRPQNPVPPIIHLRGSPESAAYAASATTDERLSISTSIIPSDFFPPGSPAPPSLPWTATALISPILEFHLTSLSDVQLPAFLTLYLAPYFPALFPPLQSTTILLSYHELLNDLCLPIQAAELRKACYPQYPEIYSHVVNKPRAPGFICTTCRKPVKGDKVGYCTRCRQKWGECVICNSLTDPLHPPNRPTIDIFGHPIPFPDGGYGLWRWCQECGHGGHVGCMDIWFSDTVLSEGMCPLQGCLCDCMPGKRREERIKEIENRKKAAKGGVLRDTWVAGESRAVELTTRALSGSGRGSGGLGAGQRGDKKVRLAVPEEVIVEDKKTVEEVRKEAIEGKSHSVP
ncbi:MAG: SEA (Seh1-associated) complex subunit [Icmadophila ericetorum]|nr:SEA (Seh1-associated) complex subunit [Icmadophila ericetorum]